MNSYKNILSHTLKFTNKFVDAKVISLVLFIHFVDYTNETNAFNL